MYMNISWTHARTNLLAVATHSRLHQEEDRAIYVARLWDINRASVCIGGAYQWQCIDVMLWSDINQCLDMIQNIWRSYISGQVNAIEVLHRNAEQLRRAVHNAPRALSLERICFLAWRAFDGEFSLSSMHEYDQLVIERRDKEFLCIL